MRKPYSYLVKYNFGTLGGQPSWQEKKFTKCEQAVAFRTKSKGSLYERTYFLASANYTDPEGYFWELILEETLV